MDVRKASGETEPYQPEKLKSSLERVGVPSSVAADVERGVTRRLKGGASTAALFERVRKALSEEHVAAAARYSLRSAIMELGPAGYYFEQYLARVLEAYGYETKTDQIVSGACTTHEIDVVAKKGNDCYLIEAKYHNRRGTKSDIKDIMYTYARGLDVKERASEPCDVWLVTNTKLTAKAKQYAQCRSLKVTAWRYPEGASLERLIEDKALYPITVLAAAGGNAREKLAAHNVYFAYELAGLDAEELARRFGLPSSAARTLSLQAKQLLNVK